MKRTLTSLQITQFLVGASYAMIHSFVNYTVPVAATVYKTTAAADTAVTGSSEAAEVAASTPTPALFDSVKQLVLGLVSKIANAADSTSTDANATVHQAAAPSTSVQEIVYHEEVVPCINTSGQTFAIWLNVLYLAPLTYLFVKFFITSYLRRSGAESARKDRSRRESQVAVAEKAGWDAARGLEAEVYGTPDERRSASKQSITTPPPAPRPAHRSRRA